MLVLTRKRGEAILIDDGRIRLVVVDTMPGRVKIAIDAPPEVRIVREELLEREDNEHE
jgi:carbon storage regulator